jgi:amino acid transporter
VSATASTPPDGGLRRDQLGTGQLTASTVANIGPGIDFYFGFGVIAATAGVAAPLTVLAAAVAVFLLCATVAEFTRAEPSAGSFITYVESGLGIRAGAATAVLVAVGYTVAMAAVIVMSGGFVSLTLEHYTSVHLPWGLLTVVLSLAALALMVRGLELSSLVIGVAVAVQVAVMVAAAAAILVDNAGHLRADPFSWSHLKGGLVGLSAGFPLALYMFIGWENGPALAEETRDPVRTVPRALYLSVAAATVLFVFFTYATVTGYHEQLGSVTRSSIPFLTVTDRALGPWAVLAWLAGIASILATLLAGTTSQARMLFDGGRRGFLPRPLARLHSGLGTPARAIATVILGGLGLIGLWALVRVVSGDRSAMDPVGLYAEFSTMGTILIFFVYLLTAVALPFFIRRRHPERFHPLRHLVVPLLAAGAVLVPFVELFSPGQPSPYDAFPYVGLGALVVAALVGAVLGSRRPQGAPDAGGA